MSLVRSSQKNSPTVFQYLSGTRHSGKYSHCLPVCLWYEALRKILPLPSSIFLVRGTQENTPTAFQYVEALRKILPLPSSISLVRGSRGKYSHCLPVCRGSQENAPTAFQYLSGTRLSGKYLHCLPVCRGSQENTPTSFQYLSGTRQSGKYSHFLPVCLWYEAVRKILPLPSSISLVRGSEENTSTSFQYFSTTKWLEEYLFPFPSSISLSGSQQNTLYFLPVDRVLELVMYSLIGLLVNDRRVGTLGKRCAFPEICL